MSLMSLDDLLDAQTRIAYTVRIATASRPELELLCAKHGLEFRHQQSSTLRAALRQRLFVQTEKEPPRQSAA